LSFIKNALVALHELPHVERIVLLHVGGADEERSQDGYHPEMKPPQKHGNALSDVFVVRRRPYYVVT